MRTIIIILFFLPILSYSNNSGRVLDLSNHLKGLDPFIGKTFKGTFINSKPEKPNIDIKKWDRALNGNAVRITNSVNNGEYGGERLILWDPEQESLISWYFSTAGIISNSFVKIEKNKLISIEDVSNNENGILKTKTIYFLKKNGKLIYKIKYFMNNMWVDGYEMIYELDSKAEVIFK